MVFLFNRKEIWHHLANLASRLLPAERVTKFEQKLVEKRIKSKLGQVTTEREPINKSSASSGYWVQWGEITKAPKTNAHPTQWHKP